MNFIFPLILGIIIPTDVHIFQRGGPTTNQINCEQGSCERVSKMQLDGLAVFL